MEDTLFRRLRSYYKEDIYPFHMPGHKRNLMPEEADSIYQMDITEIEGFDNLHDAREIIADAQHFAADIYHSSEVRFIVNGSTAGILSSIAGVCRDGGEILVARNCHKSVYHAIELHHLKPVYIYPHVNSKYGINEAVDPEKVRTLLEMHPEIQAVILTSPTYDGVVSDIESICRSAHEKKIPVIVDEAHGAHFNFSEVFPESAVQLGADLVIQSVHKTLPSMTQTAILHINGEIVDRERVRRMLTVYQSSSPSYILMGSIDSCMHMMAENGDKLFQNYTERLTQLRSKLSKLKHIHLIEPSDLEYAFDYDLSKLVLSVRNTGMTGPEFYHLLLENRLQMEMVSPDYVLAMTSVGDTDDGYNRMLEIANKIDVFLDKKKNRDCSAAVEMPQAEAVMPVYEACWSKKQSVPAGKAAGRISADYIYLYPPGIPLVTPGEIITEDVIKTLTYWKDSGMDVTGIDDDDDNIKIRVIEAE